VRASRAYWPNVNAVGQTLAEQDDPEPYVVVGVVKDVRWFSWDTEVASIYGPYALLSRFEMLTIMLQTNGQTGRVTVDALRALGEVDPLVRPSRAATLDALFVDSVRPRRFQSWLFGSLAAAGLVVVGVGILGLIAMSTARRTKEIGIRHALGATRGRIVSLLVREQMKPVVAGLLAGGLTAAWAVTFVSSYLYGITVADPRVWMAAVALIVGTAGLGALAPAARASGTDPVRALRVE
jgi:putative ABC transport system permease protein